ncbi:hypothetical protein [Pseudarthrobacter sp. AB1]|uniref:hypothetical protein n=1 Tax=Pseudarthrobacter sp. AB1 TaxID=2138309 RepID=UPI00186B8D0A|nr:hypothetical protein [Pseudarthrobacter sp. AB1]MBE4719996.1 hypothetical protein [Pseudarthrobacter sp. AB1]
MDTFEDTTAAPSSSTGYDGTGITGPERHRAKQAVTSTAKRVAEAEELLRKRKLKLREEQELMVLRKVAAERLGSDWSAKNRNAIFDALIVDFAVA